MLEDMIKINYTTAINYDYYYTINGKYETSN